MNLNILQAYCQKRKYEHQLARDGHEAYTTYVSACEAGKAPTVCLLDLQMPVCDGIACASLIRGYEQETQRPRCSIIIGKLSKGPVSRRESLTSLSTLSQSLPKAGTMTDDVRWKPAQMRTMSNLCVYPLWTTSWHAIHRGVELFVSSRQACIFLCSSL